MKTNFIMMRGMLLCGAALSLTACGGAGSGGPATIPVPPTAPVVVAPPTPPVEEKVVLTEGLTVRQNGVDYYKNGDYITYVNNWGAETLGISKSDYSQKVEITKGSFPNKTLITWKYPDQPHGDGSIVYGFPGISWGKTTLALSGYNTENAITTLGQIDKFSVKYDVTLTGDLKYMNLAHNLFMYDSTGKIGAEILFSVAASDHILYWGNPDNYFGQLPGAKNYQFSMNGANYNMLVSFLQPNNGGGLNTATNAREILIIPTDGSRVTAGTLDWAAVLKILLDNKQIDPSWIIKGTELGVEVQAGSGSMLVNDFSVTLVLKDAATQKVQATVTMVADSAAAATTAASQINAATLQQILNAAVSNPQTPTYTFGQGNVGMGTNFAVSKNLSFGTSNLFYTGATRGYTMASNLTWRNKNTYAILAGGVGTLRFNDTDTKNTFAALESGTRVNTKFASFAPYARLGYARYYTAAAQFANKPSVDAVNMNSLKVSGGVNTFVPINPNMMVRLSGEVSNEFLGKTNAVARMNKFSSASPVNVSGVEYNGSVSFTANVGNRAQTQVEVGSRKNNIGTNNYVQAGIAVPF